MASGQGDVAEITSEYVALAKKLRDKLATKALLDGESEIVNDIEAKTAGVLRNMNYDGDLANLPEASK